MGWLVAACVVILAACIPVGIRGKYSGAGPAVWLLLGPFKIKLYSQNNQKAKKNAPQKQKNAQKASEGTKASAGSWSDFLPLVKIIVAFCEEFRRKLRIKRLRLKLILGGNDPCDLSLQYGYGWAAVGNLIPLLERAFVIKGREIELECDYTSAQTRVIASADLIVTVGVALYMILRHGFKVLTEYQNIIKKRKGGASL